MNEDNEFLEKIYKDATSDQIQAIDHIGAHARLLAGPGTGKTRTLTWRVLALVLKHNIDPNSILLLTFTRMAAAQLRDEVESVLAPLKKEMPVVLTLHSFALKQILHNSNIVEELPRPIRIADGWEERNLIQEDLKATLEIDIPKVKKLINRLSADWEMLKAEEENWENTFIDPKFLGALREHQKIYGETLRAELVYRLKRLIDQSSFFKFDRDYKYILIDEYQDFNACDLAVVRAFAERGAELFVAGDDDQSIYGFRYANPVGIKQFPEVYDGAKRLILNICFRCDKEILKIAEFVANLDPNRLPKNTKPKEGASDGEVILLRSLQQKKETAWLVKEVRKVVDSGTPQDKIAILSRNRSILQSIIDALRNEKLKVSASFETELYNYREYRIVLALLKLVANQEDSLAIRTLLQFGKNGLGPKSLKAILHYVRSHGLNFATAIKEITIKPSIIPGFGEKISAFTKQIGSKIREFNKTTDLSVLIDKIINTEVTNGEIKDKIKDYFQKIILEKKPADVQEFVRGIDVSSDKIEQETIDDAVKVLSMHQAKGLTFDVCFIVGIEDEFIPGRNEGENIGDERRLLYVSMTRARHKLYLSYCENRIGDQMFLGRGGGKGKVRRRLTRFLSDSPLKPIGTQ